MINLHLHLQGAYPFKNGVKTRLYLFDGNGRKFFHDKHGHLKVLTRWSCINAYHKIIKYNQLYWKNRL